MDPVKEPEKKKNPKQIRFVTKFATEDEAKASMKKVGIYNKFGVGRWEIKTVDGSVCYIFQPGFALTHAFNQKSGFGWMITSLKAAEEMERHLGYKVMALME